MDASRIAKVLSSMHDTTKVAKILEKMKDSTIAAKVLVAMENHDADEVLEEMDVARAVAILKEIEGPKVHTILHDMTPEGSGKILSAMETPKAVKVLQSLEHDDAESVLANMEKKAAAKVLGAMAVSTASKLLTMMAAKDAAGIVAATERAAAVAIFDKTDKHEAADLLSDSSVECSIAAQILAKLQVSQAAEIFAKMDNEEKAISIFGRMPSAVKSDILDKIPAGKTAACIRKYKKEATDLLGRGDAAALSLASMEPNEAAKVLLMIEESQAAGMLVAFAKRPREEKADGRSPKAARTK